MNILVLDAGSSSHKSSLYELPENMSVQSAAQPLWEAHIDWTVTETGGELVVKSLGQKWKFTLETKNHTEAIAEECWHIHKSLK